MNGQITKLQPLPRDHTGMIVVDVQDKLFRVIENSCSILRAIEKGIKGMQILRIPVFCSEQYPQGLGPTVASLKALLGDAITLSKTSFSCMGNSSIKQQIIQSNITHWILVGIETHVCILQTAKDLLASGKQVIVLNDATGSRSIYDFSTAIAELRDLGARISSTETVLFELLRDSTAPEFKQISQLIQQCKCC